MFSKLKSKIIKSIVLLTLFFVFLINMITGIIIGNSYIQSFKDSSIETVRIAVDFSELKIETIENDSLRIIDNETIISGLKKTTYDYTIKPKLNFFRSQYQEEIIGLTLYSSNGLSYITDVDPVYAIIPFDELQLNPAINEFILSEETSARVWMNHAMSSQTISNLALIYKVIESDEIIGYLFVNINPQYLISEYFNYSTFQQFELEQNYILNQTTILNPSTDHMSSLYRDILPIEPQTEPFFSNNLKHYIIYEPLYSDSDVLITIANTLPLRQKLVELCVVLMSIDIFMVGIAYLISKNQANFITNRLSKLKERMKQAPDLIE